MGKLHFNISINASAKKVWNILWTDETYRQWTAAFTEGSYAVADWTEGSKVLFLSPGGSGMVSRVAVNRPHEYMSFEHLGEVKNGIEDTTSDAVKAWAGAQENYSLQETNGQTELQIEMDISEDYAAMFSKIWPMALENVKQLAEK